MNKYLHRLIASVLVPALLTNPVIAAEVSPAVPAPIPTMTSSPFLEQALVEQLLTFLSPPLEPELRIDVMQAGGQILLTGGTPMLAQDAKPLSGNADREKISTDSVPDPSDLATYWDERTSHAVMEEIVQALSPASSRLKSLRNVSLSQSVRRYKYELYGNDYPHLDGVAARAGYLFFVQVDQIPLLSAELRERLGPRLIQVDSNSMILNSDLGPFSAAAMVPWLSDDMIGSHFVDLGAGDGSVALAAARRGAVSFDLVEKKAGLLDLARAQLNVNGIDMVRQVRLIHLDLRQAPEVADRLTRTDRNVYVNINLGRWSQYGETTNATGLAIVALMSQAWRVGVGGYVLKTRAHRSDYVDNKTQVQALGFALDDDQEVTAQTQLIRTPVYWVATRLASGRSQVEMSNPLRMMHLPSEKRALLRSVEETIALVEPAIPPAIRWVSRPQYFKQLATALEALRAEKTKKVLVVGGGLFHLPLALSVMGIETVFLDMNPAKIAHLNKVVEPFAGIQHAPLKTVIGNIENPPLELKPGEYDAVLLLSLSGPMIDFDRGLFGDVFTIMQNSYALIRSGGLVFASNTPLPTPQGVLTMGDVLQQVCAGCHREEAVVSIKTPYDVLDDKQYPKRAANYAYILRDGIRHVDPQYLPVTNHAYRVEKPTPVRLNPNTLSMVFFGLPDVVNVLRYLTVEILSGPQKITIRKGWISLRSILSAA